MILNYLSSTTNLIRKHKTFENTAKRKISINSVSKLKKKHGVNFIQTLAISREVHEKTALN
jgi:hypothetical protein